MSKAIDSGMSNIANKSSYYSLSDNDFPSYIDNDEIENKIHSLLKDVSDKYKDFDFEEWSNCQKMKGFTDKEIYFLLSEQYNKNTIVTNKCLTNIDKISSIIGEIPLNKHSPTDSLHDLFNEVKQSIVAGKHDYLDVLKNIFSNYMDYVNELREAISSLSHYTKAGKKEGYIAVKFLEFKEKLEEVKKKYQTMSDEKSLFYTQCLFKHNGNKGYVRELNGMKIYYNNKNYVNTVLNKIENLLMDIKGIKIERKDELKNSNNNINSIFIGNVDFFDINKLINKINVEISTEGILTDEEVIIKAKKIYKKLKGLIVGFMYNEKDLNGIIERQRKENELRKEELKYKNILQTEFDLFKKSLDALEKRLNANLDELSKKYSSANSNYDNFVKIVSSTMNTLLEMAKGFLRF